MAVIQPKFQKTDALTLAECLKFFDPNGAPAQIGEILNETNEILQDVTFKEGNLPTGDEQTVRTGLPTVYWRQLNRGVPSSHSTVASVTETCSEMSATSQIDESVCNLNGNGAAFRKTEERPFIESMGQKLAHTLIYGDTAIGGFSGFATRYSTADRSKADNAKNVIDCGGTGNALTSIYIVGWGDNVYCPYPKGSAVGLRVLDGGLSDAFDDQGNRYKAYVTTYKWSVGLMVRDWRYVVRLANINVDDLMTGKGVGSGDIKAAGTTNILLKIQEALTKIPSGQKSNLAIYCNSDVFAGLNVVSQRVNSNVITFETGANAYGGRTSWASFEGVPLRQVDQITNKEKQVK